MTKYTAGQPGAPGMKELGHMLRRLRLDAGMTQQQAADRVNVTRPMISNWELGKGNITWHTLHRLVDAYGKRLEYEAVGRRRKAKPPTST